MYDPVVQHRASPSMEDVALEASAYGQAWLPSSRKSPAEPYLVASCPGAASYLVVSHQEGARLEASYPGAFRAAERASNRGVRQEGRWEVRAVHQAHQGVGSECQIHRVPRALPTDLPWAMQRHCQVDQGSRVDAARPRA